MIKWNGAERVLRVPGNEDVGVFLGSIALSLQGVYYLLQEVCVRDKMGSVPRSKWEDSGAVSWGNVVCR